jgi:hypothetical protein
MPFKRNQQPTSRPTSPRVRRFCLEELESRALPSASHAQLMADIRSEMSAIKSDMQAIMIPNASATVRMDISHLSQDVNAINADLNAGRDPTNDVNVAISADSKLKSDLGTQYSQSIHNKVKDIGNRLEVVASDLRQLKA